MVIFALVFAIILVSIAGLAAGVLLGRAPLGGTCGTESCNKVFRCAGCQKHKPAEERR